MCYSHRSRVLAMQLRWCYIIAPKGTVPSTPVSCSKVNLPDRLRAPGLGELVERGLDEDSASLLLGRPHLQAIVLRRSNAGCREAQMHYN